MRGLLRIPETHSGLLCRLSGTSRCVRRVAFFFVVMGHVIVRRLTSVFDALVATNMDHERARAHKQMRLPTIRIVRAGTFPEYRRWKGESAHGQIRVPLALVHPDVQAWISERVIREL